MSTALWLNNLDATALYGLRVAESPGARDLPSSRLDTVAIPDVPGLSLLADPVIDARTITLVGALKGTTVDDVRTKRDALLAILRRGTVTLRLADAATREIDVRIVSAKIATSGAQQLSRVFPITIETLALSPYWRDRTPQVVALSTTPAALPLGTAPSLPLITIPSPGSVVVLTLRTTLAAEVTSLQLAGLEPGVPLLIDCAARTIRQGAVSQIATLIRGDFPVLDSVTQGDFAASAWPTLALSQGTGTITYVRQWA
ncbi:MAG TPA: hypothetical protein VE861_12735 [Gemmatimonadaceae bacterium]|nr:hypothetical protein [Gemmatimonadaceae bacterium]